MKLNPVYEFIKNHDTFTYLDVHNTLHEKVVSTEYLRQAFFYFAQGAFIKKIDDPMPEQVLLWVSADYDSDESKKTGEICFKPDGTEHWGYQAYKWDDKPDFFKMGKFHKTELFKKEFGKMKEPFNTRPFGMLVDFASKKFKDEYFVNGLTHNDKKPKEKWSGLSWEEIAERTRAEISRALFYIAVHNFGEEHGFQLKPHDRTHQWQRVVDLGVEYKKLWYMCLDKITKWSPEKKAFEMFKMHWMVDSETENMC